MLGYKTRTGSPLSESGADPSIILPHSLDRLFQLAEGPALWRLLRREATISDCTSLRSNRWRPLHYRLHAASHAAKGDKPRRHCVDASSRCCARADALHEVIQHQPPSLCAKGFLDRQYICGTARMLCSLNSLQP